MKFTKELLKETILYIEATEILIDGEWGRCRTLKQLITDNDMPKLYTKLQAIKLKNT